MAIHTCKALYCESAAGPSLLMCKYHWAMVSDSNKDLLTNNTLTAKEYTKLFAIIKLEIWDRNKKGKPF